MSDVYSFDKLGNVVDMQAAQRRRIAADVMSGFDTDPDAAARAQHLSSMTGDAPGVIAHDIDGYENQLQRTTASQIVTSSDVLREFVRHNEMNAAIAQDDWDNLHNYGQVLREAQGPPRPTAGFWHEIGRGLELGAARGGSDVIDTIQLAYDRIRGVKQLRDAGIISPEEAEARQAGMLGSWMGAAYGLGHGAPAVAGGMIGAPGGAIGVMAGAGVGAFLSEYGPKVREAQAAGLSPNDALLHGLQSAGISAASTAASFGVPLTVLSQAILQPTIAGGNQIIQNYIEGKELYEGLGEAGLGGLVTAALPIAAHGVPKVIRKLTVPRDPETATYTAPLVQAYNLAKPFIEAGEEVPPGLHEITDAWLKDVDKADQQWLADAIRLADKTNMRERSTATLQDFTKIAAGERYVFVDTDAIHALYAGKRPAPDDGMLGWMPDLERQMYENLDTGNRIAIPLEQWITNVEPEVRKALKDDITVRERSNSKNDWDTIPPPQPKAMAEEWTVNNDATRLWEAVESTRKAAKLEPLEMRADAPQRLVMKKAAHPAFPGELAGEHSFMVTDEIGRHVADLEIDQTDGGKNLHVVWFGGRYVPHQVHTPVQNLFGPALIRDLFRQLREQFPNAETISGRRISGAREGTQAEGGEVKVNIDALRMEVEDPSVIGPETANFMDVAESGEWRNISDRISYQRALKDDLPLDQQQLMEDTQAIIDRVFPAEQRGRIMATKAILLDGRPVYGIWQGHQSTMPFMMWALGGAEIGAARHEVIHHLRAYGYISRDEWATLRNAATRENWIAKHDIADRYPHLGLAERLEEAIAEEFRTWAIDKPARAYSGTFGRLARLLEEIKDYFKELFGRDVTANDIFEKIERGTVAKRPMGEVLPQYFDPRTAGMMAGPGVPKAMAAPKGPRQPMLPDIIPQSERFPHEEGALVPVTRSRLYEREIEKQRTKDRLLQERAAKEQVEREASDFWLDQVAERLPRITQEVADTPGFAIDRMFREGTLRGARLDTKPKIKRDAVPPEYAAEIPQNWLSKKGESPEAYASLFGLADGKEFLDTIAQFQLARGELGPKKYFEKIVGLRVQKEMEREFGSPGELIKRQADDHVFNDGNLGLLHQDTLAMAAKLGQEHSFTKEDVKRQMETRLNTMKMKDANFKNSVTMMYRAGGKLEDALLRDDPKTAYQQVQRKENGYALAVGIKKLEKEQKGHERLVKAYRKRVPDGRDQSFTPFVHDILERIGESSRPRSDINTEMAATEWGSLAKLDEWFRDEPYEIKVIPEFLLDPNWRGDPRLLTVEQWRGINDTVQFLDKWSRDNQAYITANNRWDFRDLIDNKLVPAIIRTYPALKGTGAQALMPSKPTHLKAVFAKSLQMELIFNWWDRNDRRGIANQSIVREYATAANRSDSLDREFGSLLKKLSWIENPHRLVKQTLFRNPDTGEILDMTKMNLLGILANMGNPGNFFTMLDSFKIPREMAGAVHKLVFDNITRDDVVRMIEIGKIFDKAKGMSDRMYRQMYGVAPMNIDKWSIRTPYTDLGQNGMIEGWYYPIIHDPKFKQTSEKLAAPSPLEFPYWTKSNLPAAGYTKERTGYKGPVLLNMDGLPNRLQMIVRDVAWRPALTNLHKIFTDPTFRAAVKNHWGEHYEALLDPFLKDMAGQRDTIDLNTSIINHSLQFVRQNIISHMVGLKPTTIAKHSVTALVQSINRVGSADFGRALFTVWGKNAETGETNWTFAMNKSEELQRRHRNYLEGITGNFDQTFGHLKVAGDMREYLNTFSREGATQAARLMMGDWKAKYLGIRDSMHYAEAYPMAFLDLMSAVPTWLARYRQAKIAGENEGMAIFMADAAVRDAHGSSAVTSRPALMRNSPMAQVFGNFYTFFSHILSRQIEFAWSIRALMKGEGVALSNPKLRKDGSVIPPELELVKKGDTYQLEDEYKKSDAFKYGMSAVAPMTMMFIAYYLFPAWWDEYVAPMHGEKGMGPDKHESALWYATKVQARGLSASWMYLRDVAKGVIEGGDVSAGLMGEAGKTIYNIVRDTGKVAHQKHLTLDQKQAYIKHANQIINFFGGVGMPDAIPKMGIFGYNWYYRKEHPKTIREYWTGINRGTSHPKHH